MKVLVLRAAGTNCDRETAHAFERVGAETETRHVNELLAEPDGIGHDGSGVASADRPDRLEHHDE